MTEETPEPGSRFVVFNDVTAAVEETDQDPNFGDPNASLQAQVTSAYSGGVGGSLSAASTTNDAPTPSVIGDPAAQVMSAVDAAGSTVSAELRAQLMAAIGPMAAMGNIPGMIGQMASNAQTVLNQTTKVFTGINNIFQPEQAGTPGRCASLGDFIGSLQGKFNSALQGITSGLGAITNALISIPMAVLNSFAAAANGVITAITSGVSQAINTAIGALTGIAKTVTAGLGQIGSAALNAVAGEVSSVTAGLRAEAANLTSALNSLLNNPFKIVVPRVNICMQNILESNPATLSQNTGVAAVPVFSTGS